jgi:hypothetical protein
MNYNSHDSHDSRKFGTQSIEYYIAGKLFADKFSTSAFVEEFSDIDRGCYVHKNCIGPLTAIKKNLVRRKGMFSSIFSKTKLTKEVSEDNLFEIQSAFPNNIKRVMWYHINNKYGSVLERLEDRHDIDYEYFAILKLAIPRSFQSVYAYFHSYTSQSGFDAFGGMRVVVSYSLNRLLKYGVDREVFELIENRYIPPYQCGNLDFALEYYRKLKLSEIAEFERINQKLFYA